MNGSNVAAKKNTPSRFSVWRWFHLKICQEIWRLYTLPHGPIQGFWKHGSYKKHFFFGLGLSFFPPLVVIYVIYVYIYINTLDVHSPFSSWWLNQSFENYARQIVPPVEVKIKQYLSCHHLGWFSFCSNYHSSRKCSSPSKRNHRCQNGGNDFWGIFGVAKTL